MSWEHRTAARRSAAAIAVIVATTGCSGSERIAAPEMAHPIDAARDVSPEGYPIVSDANGTRWTLKVDQGIMVANSGEVAELSAEWTAKFANAFNAILVDAPTTVEAGLAQAEAASHGCTGMPDNPCDAYVGGLDRPTLSAQSPHDRSGQTGLSRYGRLLGAGRHRRGVDPSSISYAETAKLASNADPSATWGLRRAQVGTQPTSHWLGALRRGGSWGGSSMSVPGSSGKYLGGDMSADPSMSCHSLALRIHDRTAVWRAYRDQYMAALGELIPKAEFDPATGTMRIKWPNVSAVTSLDQTGAGLITVDTELNILAVWYSQNGCWSNIWPDNSHPASGPAGGTSTGFVYLACEPESWEISFDGGNTWSPITVSVCDFKSVA